MEPTRSLVTGNPARSPSKECPYNNEDTYQLKQVQEFLTWCADHGIKAGHLFGRQEWRW